MKIVIAVFFSPSSLSLFPFFGLFSILFLFIFSSLFWSTVHARFAVAVSAFFKFFSS